MKKRLFVALEIAPKAREAAARYISELRKAFPAMRVGWERAEKLHLTLKFFGDTDEREITTLTETVEAAARQNEAFKLQLSGSGVFPDFRKARILWLGIGGELGKITKLHADLEKFCEETGFKRENLQFKPHLTIARLREPQNAADLVKRHLAETFAPVEFPISEVIIYESLLLKSGSIYRKLQSFALK